MTRTPLFITVFALCLASLGAASAQEKFKAEIRKIEVDTTKSPEYNVGGASS